MQYIFPLAIIPPTPKTAYRKELSLPMMMMLDATPPAEPTNEMLYIETGFTRTWQPAEKALREALDAAPTWSLAERTLITSLKAIAWTLIIVGARAIHTAAFWLITLRASH